jgi:hypothetical protein
MASATTTTAATSPGLLQQTNRRHLASQQQQHQQRRPKQHHPDSDTFFPGQSAPALKLSLNSLVWAKLNNFPWWPCKIVNDASGQFSKLVGK